MKRNSSRAGPMKADHCMYTSNSVDGGIANFNLNLGLAGAAFGGSGGTGA